jgi:AraC family transcriptional regulator of arabinose operon
MPVDAEDLPETAAPSPPSGLVTVGFFDERPGYAVHRPRGADSWLFTWTTGGRGQLRQGAAVAVAGPGDLVVLGPGAPHRYAVAADAETWAFWWVHCQARPSWGAWLRPFGVGDGLHAVAPVPPGVRARVAGAFARTHADARWAAGDAAAPEPGREPEPGRVAVAHGSRARELALGHVEEIVLLATSTPTAAGSTGVDPRVRRVEALVAADPGAPHTVSSLAAAVSLSPSRLAHLYAEQLGHTPMRALRDARLRHAARLLEATALPVERVAATSGFASPFHFSRLFRERYGMPPGAYRDRHS